MPWTLWVGNRLKRTRFQPLHSRSRRTNSLSWMTILAAAWVGSMKTWKGMDASAASVRKVLAGPVSADSTRLPTTKTLVTRPPPPASWMTEVASSVK